MAYSLDAPGKRVRPLLCLASAEACGAPYRRVIDYACAVELIHTYSLIHDDLPAMDDDALRRGRATNHIVFGDATAILAGDALLTDAFGLLARSARRSHLDPAVALRMVEELAAAAGAAGMVGGQLDDIEAETKRVGRAAVESIHRRKTGALLRVAARLGVLGAGGTRAQLTAITRFAEALGLAFQIADDILDEQGTTEMTGKVQGRDHERHKSTFLSTLGLRGARRALTHQHDTALRSLRRFGEPADPLRALIDFVAARALADLVEP